jgi:DNA-directed RNA polymerase subunit F
MKRILILVVALTLAAVPAMARAADTSQATDMVELARTVLRAEKKVAFAENMWLNDEEAKAFWPVYNEYEADLSKVNNRAIKLLEEYAERFDTLTDKQANEMLDEIFSIREKRLGLQKSYIKKFGQVIPQKKVFRFFQLESAIESLINFSIAADLPYME